MGRLNVVGSFLKETVPVLPPVKFRGQKHGESARFEQCAELAGLTEEQKGGKKRGLNLNPRFP